jgi:hypothetical protein
MESASGCRVREGAKEAAQRALVHACQYLAAAQDPDGAWRGPPAPRILENALLCMIADAFAPMLKADIPAARHFARYGQVQRHHPVARSLDTWLQSAVLVGSGNATLDLSDRAFDEPAFVHRKLSHLDTKKLGEKFSPIDAVLRRDGSVQIGIVVDIRKMTGYDADARSDYIRWHQAHKHQFKGVAVVTNN